MSLIKSISGIRGIVGAQPGENLTPLDVFKFACAYGQFVKNNNLDSKVKIVIGRDSRPSGEMIKNIVVGALLSLGLDVIDLGISSTPTVELAVVSQEAQGGIIITASHNPQGWNGLKFLNQEGEFLSSENSAEVLALAEQANFNHLSDIQVGAYFFNPYLEWEHINKIMTLPLINKEAVEKQNFKIVVDGINSIGGCAIPHVLEALGIKNIIIINDSLDGKFAHRPEPLAENLSEILQRVKQEKADLGIVVDPDVDRLVFIDERGEMFGEEYTLVAIADYVLTNFEKVEAVYPGQYVKATVSNLSSSRALKDISAKHNAHYEAAAVGEVHVVNKMKEIKAVIGGEGNGGIIFPVLHYGRDALVGTALFLSALAQAKQKASALRKTLPEYFMIKDKIELTAKITKIKLNEIFEKIKNDYQAEKITEIDGLKIDFEDSWVHLRASNTEPIIRIYAEAKNQALVAAQVKALKDKILAYIR